MNSLSPAIYREEGQEEVFQIPQEQTTYSLGRLWTQIAPKLSRECVCFYFCETVLITGAVGFGLASGLFLSDLQDKVMIGFFSACSGMVAIALCLLRRRIED